MDAQFLGFTIKPKLDFGLHGYLIDGKMVKEGFVVCKNGCNIMPGATWFQTVPDAEQAIKVLLHVGEPYNNKRFWRLLHRINGATQKSREDHKQMEKILGCKITTTHGY